jgi:hypothetical protein
VDAITRARRARAPAANERRGARRRRARLARLEAERGADRNGREGLAQSARALANIDAPRAARCDEREPPELAIFFGDATCPLSA